MSTWTRIVLVEAARQGEEALGRVARAFDYRPKPVETRAANERREHEEPSEQTLPEAQQAISAQIPKLRIWRLDRRKKLASQADRTRPEFLTNPDYARKSDESFGGDFLFEPPKRLVARRRLRPFLLGAAAEGRLWSHPDVDADSFGLSLKHEKRESYLAAAGLHQAQSSRLETLRERACERLQKHHRNAPKPLESSKH